MISNCILIEVGGVMDKHKSVLIEEAITGLNIISDGVYVDCTLGRAGHALKIANKLNENGKLIGFDQDIDAIQESATKLKLFQPLLIHANFRHLKKELLHYEINNVDGFLFDFGVSSPQLDESERGFSYQQNARLDMRMDRNNPLSAYEVINDWPYEKLVKIFTTYGEERFSKQIARRIGKRRKEAKIETTFELVDIIKNAIPAPVRRKGGHPAKRTFQAIRIAVNDELNAINEALHQAAELCTIGGRIVVITFHSLEDRLCKTVFNRWTREKETPRGLPVIPEENKSPFKLITKKPIVPLDEEITQNRRARSSKLRIVEKVKEWDQTFMYKKEWI